MKKEIICCLVLLSCNLSMSAGESSSLGVKLGYNSSRFTGADIPGKGVSYQSGLTIGGFVSYKFDDMFSLQQEVLITIKGCKINTLGDIYLNNFFVYLELPFLAKASFLTEYWLRPNIYVGPAVAVLITAFNDRYFLDDIKRFDLGVVIGVSLEVWRVSLDLRLTKGMLNFDKSADDINLKNQTISMMVGYAF